MDGYLPRLVLVKDCRKNTPPLPQKHPNAITADRDLRSRPNVPVEER